MDNIKTGGNTYIDSIDIEYPLSFILENLGDKSEYDGIPVKMNSMRYYVFKNSCKCKLCNIEGTHFKLQKYTGDYKGKNSHFNLYSDDGVLLHKFRMQEGETADNFITVCSYCYKANMKIQQLFLNLQKGADVKIVDVV